MEVLDLIKNRHSPVIFEDKPVENDKIARLFEAARWSSSSSNLQPWRFIFATMKNQEAFNQLASLLNEGNYWAKKAPLLILSLTNMDAKNGPNRYAFHDVGLSTAYLMLEAASIGISTHPMAGFNVEKAKEMYHLPSNIEPVAMIAVGYIGNMDKASEELRLKESNRKKRIRKEMNEMVFEGQWKGTN